MINEVEIMRPRAVIVEPGENFTLKVGFNNGETRIFDVKPYLHGEWFSQLKDAGVFNTVHAAGLSIEWDGGQDICPDRLYYDSVPVTTGI